MANNQTVDQLEKQRQRRDGVDERLQVRLTERIGGLSEKRIREIIRGVYRVLEPAEARG